MLCFSSHMVYAVCNDMAEGLSSFELAEQLNLEGFFADSGMVTDAFSSKLKPWWEKKIKDSKKKSCSFFGHFLLHILCRIELYRNGKANWITK